jgi:hypothetical protein
MKMDNKCSKIEKSRRTRRSLFPELAEATRNFKNENFEGSGLCFVTPP